MCEGTIGEGSSGSMEFENHPSPNFKWVAPSRGSPLTGSQVITEVPGANSNASALLHVAPATCTTDIEDNLQNTGSLHANE